MLKKIVVISGLVGALALSSALVSAQQNGRGRGNPAPNTTCTQDCTGFQQGAQGGQMNGANAQNGAAGRFANAQSGQGMQNGQGAGRGGNNAPEWRGQGTGIALTAPTSPLSAEAQALMLAGWEDEAHAKAFYEAAIAQFGEIAPFVNLRDAEASHMAAWERQLTRYGIAIPSYTAPEFTAFTDLAQVYALGMDAETSNGALYETMFSEFEAYPELLRVAQRLSQVSLQRHLSVLTWYAAQ